MQNEIFNNKRIPIHGSMTRPADPEDAAAELRAGRVPWPGGNLNVTIETSEFTSVCPTTGQPDFNQVEIEYRPDRFYLESKTVKFYLWSFREHGAHCETLARIIGDHVFEAVEPISVTVVITQNPRGGLGITSSYKRSKENVKG